MGRSRSRRRRGKSGGQGSGGSGKGKGTGGSRGRSSGTRGGAGKGGSGSGKGTGGSRGRSNNTRGGQAKANRNQNKKARRTVRSVKKAVSKVAKNIGKSLRGAAANAAGVTGKPKSKLKQQLSNLRKDIAQKSTKKARFQRRADRLKRQHGLDYSRMNDSFKANVNVSQAYKHYNLDKFAPTRAIYNRLPKAVKNFSWKHQFKAPTKLGVRDGYRAPNRGGLTIAANTRQQLMDRVARSSHPEFIHSRREAAGLPSLRADPSQDIGMMYQNILGREADKEGLDYWTNEFRSGRQNMDDIRRQLVQSDEFGGRSDAARAEVQSRLKQREMEKELRDKQSKYTDKVALPWFPDGAPIDGSGKRGLYGERGLPDPDTIRGIFRKPRTGPRQDWLQGLYTRHNISGGKLDQEARDYWSNEAKTKGRKATARSIVGTAKAAGTYGGRKRPRRIDTGLTPRLIPFGGRGPKTGKPRRKRGGGSIPSIGAAMLGIRGGLG